MTRGNCWDFDCNDALGMFQLARGTMNTVDTGQDIVHWSIFLFI
jgi:hypothetical protein